MSIHPSSYLSLGPSFRSNASSF